MLYRNFSIPFKTIKNYLSVFVSILLVVVGAAAQDVTHPERYR